jgi:hypothetical protein
MIVSIIQVGTGQVPVEEFRVAESGADGVDNFVSEYAPPRDAENYVGVETAWETYEYPALGYQWAYDFDTEALVQVLL